MKFSSMDQEAIILNVAWTMIDEMVNFSIFMPINGNVYDINLTPQTNTTQRLFNILLGDFLSPLRQEGKNGLPFSLPIPPKGARRTDETFLFYLRLICNNPQFNESAQCLLNSVEEFSNWLETDSVIDNISLPSIDSLSTLKVQRIDWIKICSNIGKHSLPRLKDNVNKIIKLMRANNIDIDEYKGYVLLSDFWDFFHGNILGYHISTIAEFLNNIRWEIFYYLNSEFNRAYRVKDYCENLPKYCFQVPNQINSPFARAMYWELMNMVRSEPKFPKFTVAKYLKMRY